MEIEQQQSQLIQQFVHQASTLTVSSLPALIVEATSHPSLFSFSEILSVPNLLQVYMKKKIEFLQLIMCF